MAESKPADFTGLALAIGAALLLSTKAIFVKLAYPYGVSPLTLLALRMAFAAPFFAVVAWRARHTGEPLRRRDWIALASLGLLGYYGASILDFIGLQHITAGLERLILFTYPTITLLIAVVMFGQRFARTDVMALVLTWLGIALAFVHDVRVAEDSDAVWFGSACVLASAFCFAAYLAGCGELISRLGSTRVSGIATSISAGATLAHFSATRPMAELAQPVQVLALAAAMALFATVLPVFMNLAAMQRLGASRTAIIGSIGPISTVSLGAVFLDEALSMTQLGGTGLVVLGVWLVGRQSGR
jgi:drug/metabolite transporter (DMT)-like permease